MKLLPMMVVVNDYLKTTVTDVHYSKSAIPITHFNESLSMYTRFGHAIDCEIIPSTRRISAEPIYKHYFVQRPRKFVLQNPNLPSKIINLCLY